jgi:hypothetical protein
MSALTIGLLLWGFVGILAVLFIRGAGTQRTRVEK